MCANAMAVRTDHITLRNLGFQPLQADSVNLLGDCKFLHSPHVVKVHDVVRVLDSTISTRNLLQLADALLDAERPSLDPILLGLLVLLVPLGVVRLASVGGPVIRHYLLPLTVPGP